MNDSSNQNTLEGLEKQGPNTDIVTSVGKLNFFNLSVQYSVSSVVQTFSFTKQTITRPMILNEA